MSVKQQVTKQFTLWYGKKMAFVYIGHGQSWYELVCLIEFFLRFIFVLHLIESAFVVTTREWKLATTTSTTITTEKRIQQQQKKQILLCSFGFPAIASHSSIHIKTLTLQKYSHCLYCQSCEKCNRFFSLLLGWFVWCPFCCFCNTQPTFIVPGCTKKAPN